ncbi:hypothetical protein EON65_39635 [archaeon]|nr:MAG: hypothetical protein EON65_39635 [archaeon]
MNLDQHVGEGGKVQKSSMLQCALFIMLFTYPDPNNSPYPISPQTHHTHPHFLPSNLIIAPYSDRFRRASHHH